MNRSVQNIIQPRMMGERLQFSPVVVFASRFVWGWPLGGIGAIPAVPLTNAGFSSSALTKTLCGARIGA